MSDIYDRIRDNLGATGAEKFDRCVEVLKLQIMDSLEHGTPVEPGYWEVRAESYRLAFEAGRSAENRSEDKGDDPVDYRDLYLQLLEDYKRVAQDLLNMKRSQLISKAALASESRSDSTSKPASPSRSEQVVDERVINILDSVRVEIKIIKVD